MYKQTLRRLRALSAAAAVAVGLASPATSLAAGQNGSPAAMTLPAGIQVVNGFYMDDNMPLPAQARRETLQGDHVPGGCGFRGQLHLAVGSEGVTSREIGYNPTTCQEIVVVGKIGGATALPSRTPRNGAVQPTTSGTFSSGHLWSAWKDPANINTTEVRSIVEWFWDNTCVNSATGTYQIGQYTASGWALDSVSPANDITCAWDEEDVSAHFHNSYFPGCGGYTAYADYWYNRVYGHADGTLDGSWYTTVSGGANGCTSLLYQVHDLSYGN